MFYEDPNEKRTGTGMEPESNGSASDPMTQQPPVSEEPVQAQPVNEQPVNEAPVNEAPAEEPVRETPAQEQSRLDQSQSTYSNAGTGTRYDPRGNQDEGTTVNPNGVPPRGHYDPYQHGQYQQNGYYNSYGYQQPNGYGYTNGNQYQQQYGGYSQPYGQSQQGTYRYHRPVEEEPRYQQPPVHDQPNNNQPPVNEKPKRKKADKTGLTGRKLVAAMLACVLLGGAAGFGGSLAAMKLTGHSTSITKDQATVYASDRTPASVNTELVEAGDAMTTAQIYKAYNDSVVCITVQTAQGTGAGTGFFISDDGYIMTCEHVVNGQQAMSVTLNDGTTSYAAEYVGGDAEQDVAIIRIKPEADEKFHAVTLGDSDLLQVGDDVTVIGNALGELANTTTGGMVSALNRAITMSDGTVMNLLQTDTTINSGNSGGPMFNQFGEVIGIVNAKFSSSGYSSSASIEGIGFAIPINTATKIMPDLMEHGYITGKPYLGISVSTVSSIMAQQYPNQYVVGALVNSVNKGSCAEKAGLQAGDIITQVDGEDITTSAELIDLKAKHRAGETMTMLVFRNKEYYTITVTLDEEQPNATQNDSSNPNQGNGGNGYNGGNGFGGNGGNGYGNGGYGYSWPWSFFGGW